MNRTISRTLSIVALAVAVFVVGMAGSATAAKLITGKDIKNGSVTGTDIKNGSLAGRDVKQGAIGETRLAAGVKNKLNADTLPGYEVATSTTTVASGSADSAYVACSPGKVAIGGGGSFETTEFNASIQESVPQRQIGELFAPADADLADGWKVTGQHTGLDPVGLTAWVICVTP